MTLFVQPLLLSKVCVFYHLTYIKVKCCVASYNRIK
jgi:hypothetical protein